MEVIMSSKTSKKMPESKNPKASKDTEYSIHSFDFNKPNLTTIEAAAYIGCSP